MGIFNERVLKEGMLNSDMCNGCGLCCERKPCQYYPSDFNEFTKKLVETMIWEYKAIIDVAAKKLIYDVIDYRYLVLRVKGEMDDSFSVFVGMKNVWGGNHNKCVHLGSNGCLFDVDKRPGLGLYYIPKDYGANCFLSSEGYIKETEWHENIRIQKILGQVIRDNGEEEKFGRFYEDFVHVKSLKRPRI